MIETDQVPSWLSRGLNLLGVGVVGYYLFSQRAGEGLVAWAFVSAVIALAAWLAYTAMPRSWHRAGVTALTVMIVCGSLATAPTNGLAIVPAVVALMQTTRRLSLPLGGAIAFGLVAFIAVPIGALPVGTALLGVLTMEAGVVVAFLAGLSRRQFRAAEVQSRRLLESAMAMREEQATVAALAARQGIARDIHDVLAHSLGGLVIQLDAVEALLEAGSTEAAAARIHDSRELAVDGLREARRAIDALRDVRDGAAAVAAEGVVEGLAALMDAHRSLGGELDFSETGDRRPMPEVLASALHRALQESLTNARKHAPGRRVAAALVWTEDAVVLTVENARAGSASDGVIAGGGHGLSGMRERFAALPGGEAAAGVEGDRFLVRVRGNL